MNSVAFYIEYRNERVMLPVNPEELTVVTPSGSVTEKIINLGDVPVLQLPGLQSLSFSSFIPTITRGGYVRPGAQIFEPLFYVDFFQAIQKQREPINLVGAGLGFSLNASVEEFGYTYIGGDDDMWYDIAFQEYRSHGSYRVQQEFPTTPRPQPVWGASSSGLSRSNVDRKIAAGSSVRVAGTVYRDSEGLTPLFDLADAVHKVNLVSYGSVCPYHLVDDNGVWVGWVKSQALEVV